MSTNTIASVFADETKGTWAKQHNNALHDYINHLPQRATRGERNILDIYASISDWSERMVFEPDYLAVEFVVLPLLSAFRQGLNWDRGRLDGGTLDAWACSLGAALGINMDMMEVIK